MLQTIMRQKEVEKRIGLACSTIYALMACSGLSRRKKPPMQARGALRVIIPLARAS